MPELLDYDDRFVTLQGADGRAFRTARETAQKLFPDLQFDAPPPPEPVDPGGLDLFGSVSQPEPEDRDIIGPVPEDPPGPGELVNLDQPPMMEEGEPIFTDGAGDGSMVEGEPRFLDEETTPDPSGPKFPKLGIQAGMKKGQDLTSRGFERRGRGIAEGQVAKAGGFDAMADERDQGETDVQAIRNKRERLRLKREEEEQDLSDKYKAMVQERLNAKVDRGRYWSNLSTGRKVLGLVGMIMVGAGNVLEGKGGADNDPLNRLLAAVKDDVGDQRFDIAKMGKDIGLQKGLLQDYRSATKTKLGEFNLQVAERLEQVKRTVASIMDRTNSAVAKAKGTELLGVLDIQIGAHYKQTAMAEQNAIARAAAARRKEMIRLEAQRYKRAQDLFARKTKIHELGQKDRELGLKAGERRDVGTIIDPTTQRPLPGVHKFAGNPKLVAETHKRFEAWTSFKRKLHEYREKMKSAGRVYKGWGADRKFVKSQDAADLEAQHLDLLSTLILARSGKVANKEEVERLAKILPPPRTWTERADPTAQLDRFLRTETADVMDHFTSMGFKVKGASGKPLPGTVFSTSEARRKTAGTGGAPLSQIEKLTKKALAPGSKKLRLSNRVSSITKLAAMAKKGNGDALAALKEIEKKTSAGATLYPLLKRSIRDGEGAAGPAAEKRETKRAATITKKRQAKATVNAAALIRKKHGPKSRQWFNFTKSKRYKRFEEAIRWLHTNGETVPKWVDVETRVRE